MISEVIYLHYLNALLEGNKKECMQIVVNLIDQKISLKEIYVQLFQRSMYRIGTMWEKERCGIADEHIATKITESLIELVNYSFASKERNGKLAVITGIDKEFHELGAKMVAGYFEASGWDTCFLGSNSPQSEVLRIIEEKKPNLVGISSSFYINIMRLIKLIQSIKEKIPDQEILVGGQALADGRAEGLSKFDNVKYIASLNELEEYIVSFQKLDF
jgi:methanogenic corrinoid protein MtbC1